ncbi:hypothetical protein H6F43_14845 [Leptolyngbya sp. FACHB-36]|nr:hypothetical protein [Leptolyngbya sp. FACHB-36]
MNRLLYEHSTPHRGYLIVPYVFALVGGETLYSYTLLSERGRKGKFHKAGNPAGVCNQQLARIIAIAKAFLDQHSDIKHDSGYFVHRYTYQHNLIVLIEEADKWFYDHYPPEELTNIAAPKLFSTQDECLAWIRQGLDRNLRVDQR